MARFCFNCTHATQSTILLKNGIELCVELRKSPRLKDTLVVLLTARGEDYSQVAGFDAGADDYIVKPIKPRLLTSKLQAILRRKGGVQVQEEATDLPLSVDHESFTVKLNGEKFELPKKEFKLLALLLSKPGKVFTRDEILERVWGTDTYVGDRTIDVHIRKIREKIGSEYIRTIKGVGYKLELA